MLIKGFEITQEVVILILKALKKAIELENKSTLTHFVFMLFIAKPDKAVSI